MCLSTGINDSEPGHPILRVRLMNQIPKIEDQRPLSSYTYPFSNRTSLRTFAFFTSIDDSFNPNSFTFLSKP